MASSGSTSTGALAADYARYGLALCAIPVGSKGPITTGWNLRENAITDYAVAAKLTENVGLLHAYSETMALDVDDDVQAQEWLRARGVDPRSLVSSPDHVGIISGREGRGKLLYRLPNGIGPIQTVQIKGVADRIILEFRCADAGGKSVQDVLPPSIHPVSGKPYRWGGPGDWRSPPVIPDALLKAWREELAKRSKANPPLPLQAQIQPFNKRIDLSADTAENREELARALGVTVSGRRVFDPDAGRDEWLRDLWSIEALGVWTHDVARDWSKEGGTFDAQKFEQDWASFDPSRAGGITVASFFAKLRDAGISDNFVRHAAAPVVASPPVAPVPSPSLIVPPSPSLMKLPHLLSAALAVREANRFIGFAHDWGGKPILFWEDAAGQVHPCKRDEMKALLANRFVDTGAGARKLLFPFWEASPLRRTVSQVVYDPTGCASNANSEAILNLWRGFARKPQPGNCPLMIMHLHAVVCRGNAQHFHYLLAWMAHLVQRPWEAPGVVIVLRSQREGTGKTTVLGWLSAMLGIHALMLSDTTQLLGRFNSHLETISFVGLNELGWAGDKDAAAKLKSIITDPTIIVERKHGGVYSVPNILHIMATSNNDWVVPAGDGARRFFVLDVDPTRAGDRAYFDALYHEAENGGIEAIMDYLQRFKLDTVNLRAVPVTDALREQQERSLSLQAQWALDLADRAGNVGFAGAVIFGQTVLTRALYEDYLIFAAGRRVRPLEVATFGKWLTKIGLEDDRNSTSRQRILPSVHQFARLVRKSAGVHQ